MRPRVAAFGALGTVATLLAAAVAFAPDVVAGTGPLASLADALAAVNARHLLLAASGVVGLFLSVAGWRAARTARGDGDGFDEATATPPEAVTTARQRRTATDLDGAFDDAVDGDTEARERVRERLRGTAARAYAHATGCQLDAARAAVRDGTWTDDRTAAAALADADGPTHSVGARLRLWLDPERERERRFTRTVAATAALGGSAS